MDLLVLLTVILASSALAVAGARGTLALVLHAMAHPTPIHIRWGRVFFAGAVFWLWYLAPVVAEKLTAL